jgi:predicted N-acetyltransferase YhbS
MKKYPAVLIGRLGVSTDFKRKGIGIDLMNLIKYWFINPNNKTGCRYIVVDSYNEEIPLEYYGKNGFIPMFTSEEQEKEYFNISTDRPLKTRLLYFDLIELRTEKQG